MTLNEIEKEISALAIEDKAEILRNLIIELDGIDADGVEKAWLEEIERRHYQLKSGIVKAVPLITAFTRARERLENEG